MFRPNRLKRRLAEGRPAFGIVHALAHAATAEMIGLAGFDYVLIDGEHGMGDLVLHLQCLQAVASTPATALLRLEAGDPILLKRFLDLGAEGIMAPDVRNASQAEQIVAACRYPPTGIRGYAASGVRASDYGLNTAAYLREYESQLLIAIILESGAAADRADEICSVEGIDIIQIGANDLSYDLGVPEQLDHPRVRDAIHRIETAARRHGKVLGGAPLPSTDAAALIEKGYQLITLGRDVGMLAKALTAAHAAIQHHRAVD